MDSLNKCAYCPHPAASGHLLCDFHADWECCCNLVEDEYGGSIPESAVVSRMISWGWRLPVILARRNV
jgi:hypothetical protein